MHLYFFFFILLQRFNVFLIKKFLIKIFFMILDNAIKNIALSKITKNFFTIL